MQLFVTSRLREVLQSAAHSPSLAPSLKQDALKYLNDASVPFSVVKACCLALRGAEGESPWVDEVCKGSRIILYPPKKRERSPELIRRIEELQKQDDERKYQAMVKNVAKRDYQDNSFSLLPTYRLQLSFGMQVLLSMFVFYMIGSFASRVFSDNPVVQSVFGVLGLTFGLILETSLFMLRSIPLEGSKQKKE